MDVLVVSFSPFSRDPAMKQIISYTNQYDIGMHLFMHSNSNAEANEKVFSQVIESLL